MDKQRRPNGSTTFGEQTGDVDGMQEPEASPTAEHQPAP